MTERELYICAANYQSSKVNLRALAAEQLHYNEVRRKVKTAYRKGLVKHSTYQSLNKSLGNRVSAIHVKYLEYKQLTKNHGKAWNEADFQYKKQLNVDNRTKADKFIAGIPPEMREILKHYKHLI